MKKTYLKTFVIRVCEGIIPSLAHTLAPIGAEVKEIGGGVVLVGRIHPAHEEKVANFLQGVEHFFGK